MDLLQLLTGSQPITNRESTVIGGALATLANDSMTTDLIRVVANRELGQNARRAATIGLGGMRNQAALIALTKIIRDNSETNSIRETAIDAISAFGVAAIP